MALVKRFGPALLALALALLACNLPGLPGAATATPAASNTPAAPAPTPTPPSANTPTPAATPTSAPPAATPGPSPTPRGYYQHDTAGFALTVPINWVINSEDPSGVVFADTAGGLLLLVYRDTDPARPSLEAVASQFAAGMAGNGRTMRPAGEGEVVLADGLTAPTVDLLDDTGSNPLLVRLALAVSGPRRLIVILYINPSLMDTRATLLNQVYGSLRFSSLVYGLDRRETLLVLGGDPEPKDLDPARATGSASGYVGMLFAGLVRLSPDLQIVPDLAESWDISPDGLTYTFTLREGLTFASGRPLTAADVVYSWERAADPATDSPTAGTYLADILGVDEMLAGDADHIAGLEAVDDRTLVVTLDAPKAYFLAKLTYPTAFVVSPDNVSGARWMFTPDPSGPYALHEYVEDETIIFERNAAFHAPAGIRYVAYLLQLGGQPLSLYEIGDLDIVGLQPADADEVSQPGHPRRREWQSATTLCTTLLQLDISRPPLDDPAVRRALILALDRAALNEQFNQGASLLAHTVLPPAMPGYSSDLPRFTYDQQAAAAALAASSYAGADLPAIIINEAGSGQAPSAFITAVADMWRQALGLSVEIQQLDPLDYTRAARAQHGHVVSYGWCADYPDPENFLDILFHTRSGFNVGGYSSAEVDALLEAARSEPDAAARLDLYRQAETRILGDIATIPLTHSVADVLVQPYVKNYVLSPLGALVIPLLTFEFDE
jgi:oligopeptide transport system substrate-binding protein